MQNKIQHFQAYKLILKMFLIEFQPNINFIILIKKMIKLHWPMNKILELWLKLLINLLKSLLNKLIKISMIKHKK
jgi:hypothetical protein